ncbi:hypothetical protein EJ03DRAFT_87230 [Teratosphaeria nubilosa]|uniref:Uncharacterized protein n=1 Tax=Teratosphaeria nubilosa TaxID=161662 RepID=A0A6G1L9V3_9PEZI|nr:hypothetical protein EJ03DRAFT_87230 [Teratosphaeria nubilosa]
MTPTPTIRYSDYGFHTVPTKESMLQEGLGSAHYFVSTSSHFSLFFPNSSLASQNLLPALQRFNHHRSNGSFTDAQGAHPPPPDFPGPLHGSSNAKWHGRQHGVRALLLTVLKMPKKPCTDYETVSSIVMPLLRERKRESCPSKNMTLSRF